ncbi:MAG: hypothetical protein ACU84J_09660, partial [Gammaproteobacteria bacterium]
MKNTRLNYLAIGCTFMLVQGCVAYAPPIYPAYSGYQVDSYPAYGYSYYGYPYYGSGYYAPSIG